MYAQILSLRKSSYFSYGICHKKMLYTRVCINSDIAGFDRHCSKNISVWILAALYCEASRGIDYTVRLYCSGPRWQCNTGSILHLVVRKWVDVSWSYVYNVFFIIFGCLFSSGMEKMEWTFAKVPWWLINSLIFFWTIYKLYVQVLYQLEHAKAIGDLKSPRRSIKK